MCPREGIQHLKIMAGEMNEPFLPRYLGNLLLQKGYYLTPGEGFNLDWLLDVLREKL